MVTFKLTHQHWYIWQCENLRFVGNAQVPPEEVSLLLPELDTIAVRRPGYIDFFPDFSATGRNNCNILLYENLKCRVVSVF